MLRFLSAAAFGLAVFLLFVNMSVAQPCMTPNTARENLARNVPGLVLREMQDTTASTFVAAFNALPPRSDVVADGVLLVRHAQAPQAVAVFFRQGCMVGRAVLPTAILDALLASIEKAA